MPLQIGDPAPPFSAIDQDGHFHSLAQYLGQNIVLYFYPEDDTPGCTTEACSFRDAYAEIQEKAVLLGVSSDSQESHEQFVKKYALPFPLLVDGDERIIEAYGANGLFFTKRVTFLIDQEGKIAKIYNDVKPENHVEEVLRDVRSLT